MVFIYNLNMQVDKHWKVLLENFFCSYTGQQLKNRLDLEETAGKIIFPPKELRFQALWETPLHQTKVVILGQDPYHGVGQADGLAFSVFSNTKVPPSLRNIFKELQRKY